MTGRRDHHLPNVVSLPAMTPGADGSGLFDMIAAGDMAARKKPAPDIHKLASERPGLPPCLGAA